VVLLELGVFAGTAVTGYLLPGIGFAVTIAVFHVANRTSRRTSLIIGLVALVVTLIAGIISDITSGSTSRVFQFVVTVAFASAVGDATRSRREYLVAVTERAERAEQTREAEAQRRVAEERLKIARDLHDAVAHQISVISLNAGVASSSLQTQPTRALDALGVIRQASRSVLREIGELMRYLRSEEGVGAETPDAPQPGLSRLEALVQSFTSTGLAVTVRTEGDLSSVTGIADLVAYRTIQEGLTNAHKHGAEHRAHLLIEREGDSLNIVIANPVEFGSENHPEPTGYGNGLLGLRERVALAGGQVDTAIAPGGYRLTVRLPLTSPYMGEGERA
jgi:signal transduction histidine kinase